MQFDVARHHLRVNALVVVVYGNRKDLFRPLLTDHVLIEDPLDLCGFGHG